MAWTAPRTWVAGEVVTAAMLNTHVRDNLLALGSPAVAAYTPTVVGVATSFAAGRWSTIAGRIKVDWQIVLSGVPTGTVSVSLPVNASSAFGFGATPRGDVVGLRAGAKQSGSCSLLSATTFTVLTHGVGVANWAAGAPVAWASGDSWSGSLDYEPA